EEIVVRLDATEIVLGHRGAALFETSGPRTEGDAVGANLPLRPERFERLPDGRIPDRGRVRIVELEHIDVGRCEPIQRLLQGCSDRGDRKSTRLNSSHLVISYAVFCLKKKKNIRNKYGVKTATAAY